MSSVSGLSFGAQLEDWVRETEQRMEAVFKQSAQEVVSLAQSRIPIDTGFARASLQGSLSEMPPIDPGKRGVDGATYPESTAYVLTIAGARLGQTLRFGWTASYVELLEWGHSMQAPLGFVGISAIEWPRIVAEVTAELGQRLGR